MDWIRLVLLTLHLLGFAALFGGLVVQAREPQKVVNAAMRDGAGTAFLAGLLLVGVLMLITYIPELVLWLPRYAGAMQ